MTKIVYLLSLNRYSRSGRKGRKPTGIVVHHSDNENYGGIETRNFFDNLKHGKNAIYYSTHYIIGFDGEIIYCVPEEEVAYHRGNSEESNGHISVTCCSNKKSDEPSKNTLRSLRWLVRDIANRYGFNANTDLYRHYDISGAKCPRFFVENKNEWQQLKNDIIKEISISEYLEDNSLTIAENVSKLTGIKKKYLHSVLKEEIELDLSTLLKIFETCKA